MPTFNRHPFSGTKNVNIKKGLIRFAATHVSPFAAGDDGLFVNKQGQLVFSHRGVLKTLINTSPSISPSASSSRSLSPSSSVSSSSSASRSPSASLSPSTSVSSSASASLSPSASVSPSP